MKNKILFLIIIMILILTTTVYAIDVKNDGVNALFENVDYNKSDSIRVYVDSKQIYFDVNPQIVNGRTLVPMRAIFEAIGLTVDWDNYSQAATGTNGDNSIVITIGSNNAIVNGKEKILDVPASIIGSRTMVPLRVLSENMGYNVVWVGDSNLILMSKNNVVEWRYEGYESIEPYKEYEALYVNGVKSNETRYNGKYHDVVVEWRNGGYESAEPYKEYEIKYIDGVKTSETRYTGNTRPLEIKYKEVSYKWEYPYGWLTWEYTLNISEDAVKIYKSIDRRYISGYSYYVTQEADDEYMKALANVFVNTAKDEGYSEWDVINLAVSFVQGLEYVSDKIGTGYDEYPKFPLETLYDKGGDCEDTSILLASLLRELGYGTVLVMTDDHMGVGIKTDEQANFQYLGMNFYYIETTYPGWDIGELPPELDGVAITILPVN